MSAEFADQLRRSSSMPQSGEDRYDYIEEHGKIVVVTDAMYDDVLAPLIQWKIEKGLETEVVYADDFGDDYEAIKDFLADQYLNEGLTHVILAGDEDQVPATLVTNGGGTGYCDPCYAYVEGNDHYPEFFVGRLLVHDGGRDGDVGRTHPGVREEPVPREEWFNIAVGIGSNEGAGIGDNGESDWQHLNAIKDKLIDYDFQEVWELYDGSQGGNSPTGGETADEAGNPNANDMVELVNKGLSFINYTGHGYHGGIASSGFDINAIGQTTNNGMYGFFVPVACCVGDFDEGEGPATVSVRCGSSTSNGEPAGGIGGAFSSVLQSWAPPMKGQDEMTDLVVEDGEVEIRHTFGSIVAHGCSGMIDAYGGGGEEMMDTWCIFGDPTVVMRTAFPTELALSHQDVYFLGTPTLDVASPTEGAPGGLDVQRTRSSARAFVENGMATIALDAPSPSRATTVDGHRVQHHSLPERPCKWCLRMVPTCSATATRRSIRPGTMTATSTRARASSSSWTSPTSASRPPWMCMVTITTADEWVVITDGAESAGDIDADGTLTLPASPLTWWPAWPTSTWRCSTWRWWMRTATSGRRPSMWC